jgi:dihydropteroate synthase
MPRDLTSVSARPARGPQDGSRRQVCQVMGIVNVTPDSFSDGGMFLATENAVRHGLELFSQGADIVDVGGESTRPGAPRVSVDVEMARVIPVIEQLSRAGVAVSVDTTRAAVADAAVEAGALMVNDVSGGLADPGMASTVAGLQVPYVAMHWRGHSVEMQQRAVYGDVVADVKHELSHRVADLLAQGVDRDQLILDPGIGFAKQAAQSWELLRCFEALQDLGQPLLVGASRKSLLAEVRPEAGEPMSTCERDVVTAVITALLATQVSWIRVHDVRANVLAVKVAERLRSEG